MFHHRALTREVCVCVCEQEVCTSRVTRMVNKMDCESLGRARAWQKDHASSS